MISHHIKIVLIFALLCPLLITGCGKESLPTRPEPEPAPDLFPLAQGAKWEYSFSFSAYSGNYYDGLYRRLYIWGTYSIAVVNEIVSDSARMFMIECHYHQDSLFSVKDNVKFGSLYPSYNDTTLTYDSRDTTFTPNSIHLVNDTLWYDDGTLLTPLEPESGSPLLLKVFDISGLIIFSRLVSTFQGYSSDSLLVFTDNYAFYGVETYSTTIKHAVGPVSLRYKKGATSANLPHEQFVEFKLTDYTPGTPVGAP